MSEVVPNTPTATYSWHEAIERIAACDTVDELSILCDVLTEEKKKYALFFLQLIRVAAEEKLKYLRL